MLSAALGIAFFGGIIAAFGAFLENAATREGDRSGEATADRTGTALLVFGVATLWLGMAMLLIALLPNH